MLKIKIRHILKLTKDVVNLMYVLFIYKEILKNK